MQELLSRGADPNIEDFQGYSPWIVGVLDYTKHMRAVFVAMIDNGGPILTNVVISQVFYHSTFL